ncbi:MAG: DUF2868 domain-containing protein [Desulfobacteraceae bacterium]|nr:DUF2868 domain-containing protein [Desulfobacteraceae bacterium]
MANRWRIRDIIDLEYFLHQDPDAAPGRDRGIYLEYIRSHPGPPKRRALLRYWLENRRRREAERQGAEALPGAIYHETAFLTGIILCILALAAGVGLAWTLLSYSGRTPVNVFTCLWVLLAPQVFLLAILLVSACISRIRRGGGLKTRYPWITLLIRRLAERMLHYAGKNLSKDRKNRLQSAMGLVGQTRTVYGGIFFWPVFNTAQTAGVCFNIGILAAMLLRITITDVAFGWQSTLQPDPQTVYQIVQIMAAPWAWFAAEPLAHPTAAQIAGSKMILKDGLYHLSTRDLASWWPFLCLCVTFYGLLPRVMLLAVGAWRQYRELAAVKFTHAACDRLWQRMTAPLVETTSRTYGRDVPAEPATASEFTNTPHGGPDGRTMMPAIVAVPEEIALDRESLERRLGTRLGVLPAETITVNGNRQADAEKLARALQSRQSGQSCRLVIIQESWQPPIKENLAWIRHMKQAAGPETGAIVALIGKPGKAGALAAPVPEAERILWQQAVNTLGDPYIRVEVLGEKSREN